MGLPYFQNIKIKGSRLLVSLIVFASINLAESAVSTNSSIIQDLPTYEKLEYGTALYGSYVAKIELGRTLYNMQVDLVNSLSMVVSRSATGIADCTACKTNYSIGTSPTVKDLDAKSSDCFTGQESSDGKCGFSLDIYNSKTQKEESIEGSIYIEAFKIGSHEVESFLGVIDNKRPQIMNTNAAGLLGLGPGKIISSDSVYEAFIKDNMVFTAFTICQGDRVGWIYFGLPQKPNKYVWLKFQHAEYYSVVVSELAITLGGHSVEVADASESDYHNVRLDTKIPFFYVTEQVAKTMTKEFKAMYCSEQEVDPLGICDHVDRLFFGGSYKIELEDLTAYSGNLPVIFVRLGDVRHEDLVQIHLHDYLKPCGTLYPEKRVFDTYCSYIQSNSDNTVILGENFLNNFAFSIDRAAGAVGFAINPSCNLDTSSYIIEEDSDEYASFAILKIFTIVIATFICFTSLWKCTKGFEGPGEGFEEEENLLASGENSNAESFVAQNESSVQEINASRDLNDSNIEGESEAASSSTLERKREFQSEVELSDQGAHNPSAIQES